ncbi:replicative DNA helicase [Kitasatospora sp. NA04385]|uniref:replicative DNA helicase n=1 Tax=Kitasatospora sp. NA04385 TaxID=2742135 RepID=UPI001592269F|nr:replicative DNA helicase [Kitasatospora sp. NA04385]QKW20745.1 replicative DNA helicase [Kitasatospora sp. NA04385]
MTGPQYDDHDAPPPPEDDWQPSDDAFPLDAFPDVPGDRLPVSRRSNGQSGSSGGRDGGREGGRDGGSGGREGGSGGGFQRRDGGKGGDRFSGKGERRDRDGEREGGFGGEGFERVPPQDLAAEQSVLGGMLLSKDAIADVVEVLKPADYYRPAHELIHGAILDLYARGEPADPITVAGELTKRGELTRVGGASYLHTLVNSVPTAANAEYYAEIVHERAVLRRLVEAGTRIAGMGYAAEGDVDDIVNAAQAEIYAVTEQRTNEDYAPLADIMEGALDEIEAIGSRSGQMSGVPTGFADFDQLTNGLHPGQMIVIAARPAMGKSTLALDFARACSIHNNLPSVIFSLEMGRNEIAMRLLSAEARVALHHMRSGNMTDDDWTRVARRMPEVSAAPLYIDDSPNLSMMEIRAKCRRLKQRNDLRLVVIDYLQLMQSGGSRRAESRQQEVSDMSRNLKLLAKELEIPVIALSQLNRGPEQRTDKKPMVSDLRESGSIEQDADMVILLHREDAYEKESPRAGEADLIVAKHRNGPTATITVAFQGHYSRFVDMTRDVT